MLGQVLVYYRLMNESNKTITIRFHVFFGLPVVFWKRLRKNQVKLDHGCIGALEALKTENPTEDGNWVCDDIFVPKPEYTCKNVCKADGKVSGEISVKCRLGGTESKIRGYVDCPPLIR